MPPVQISAAPPAAPAPEDSGVRGWGRGIEAAAAASVAAPRDVHAAKAAAPDAAAGSTAAASPRLLLLLLQREAASCRCSGSQHGGVPAPKRKLQNSPI